MFRKVENLLLKFAKPLPPEWYFLHSVGSMTYTNGEHGNPKYD